MLVILLIHVAATWFLVGLIWTIQIVHYAQFDGVGDERWCAYHRRHTRNITWIVAPAMGVELVTAIALCVHVSMDMPMNLPAWMSWLGLGLVALLWLSTAMLQVPLHRALRERCEPEVMRRLLLSNWVRTGAWTARGLLVLAMLNAVMGLGH